MTAGPNRLQQLKEKVYRAVLDGLRRLTEPSVKAEPPQRRRIRLLAAFMLIMSVNTLVGSLYVKNVGGDAWNVMLATVIVFFLGYLVSRTRYHRIALGIAITAPAIPSIAFGILQPPEFSSTTELMWLALPLLVASVMLTVRQTILVALIYFLIISALGIRGLIEYGTMGQILSFLLVISFFVIVITHIRRKDQAELENQLSERLRIEGILRESEEKFRNLFEHAKDAIILADAQTGIIVDINPAGCRLTGLPKNKSVGRHQSELYPPELAEEYQKSFQENLEKGMFVSDDIIIQNADGSHIQCDLSAGIIKTGDRELIQGVFRDVTERKRMEKALRESEEKFYKAFHASPEPIAITTLKDGKYIEVNDSYLRYTGYNREELMGQTTTGINIWANPKERDRLLNILKKKGRVSNEEFDFRIKSGEIRTWLFSAEHIDITGEPCLIGVSIDITEWKRSVEAIRERERRFSDIAENSMEWIWEVDAKGKYTYSSPIVEKILGYKPEEIIKKHFYDLFLPEEREGLKKAAFQAFAQKQPIKEFINRNRCKNGKTVELLTTGVPVIDEAGNLLGYRGVDTDITERLRAEKALKESETKFSAAFRFSPNTMAITRVKNGKFIDINDSHTRITGYTREEAIGHTSLELGIWAKEEDRIRMLEILKKKGYVNSEEFEFRMKNGDIRTWLFSAERITIGGEPCIISITVDITGRKRAEKLQKDENHVLMLLGQGVEIHELLEAIVRMGESHDPAIKCSVMFYDAQKHLLLPEAMPSLPASYRKLMENGIPIGPNLGTCGTAAHSKQRVIDPRIKDYTLFPKEVADQVVAHGLLACWSQPIIGTNGDLLGTIANYSSKTGNPSDNDIRVLEWSAHIAAIAIERRRAEVALRESEEKFYRAFHASPDVMVIVRIKDDKFIEVNENFIRLNGYTREEVIGQTSDGLNLWVKEEDRVHMLETLKKNGYVDSEEYEFRTKNGEIRTWLFSAERVTIGGEPCIISITIDITERKRMDEELKQALAELKHSSAQLEATNKELEAFSYSVSHDLRSPLRSIDGFSQALLEDYDDKLDDTGRDYLNRLRGASQKMGDLIDGMLKLSRLTRNEMHLETVDLSVLANEIAERLQESQPKRRVKFIIDKGLTTRGDHQFLRVLLENLLGNAWKFSKNKPNAKIEFSLDHNGDKKAYFIRDNGAGFDMTYANKLFNAFQRLHDTTEFPGTGIGLATVQRIINRHGGTIWAEGEVGKGATFYFTLN
jgi:PAS domain S-box-containing protein